MPSSIQKYEPLWLSRKFGQYSDKIYALLHLKAVVEDTCACKGASCGCHVNLARIMKKNSVSLFLKAVFEVTCVCKGFLWR